VFWVLNTSCTLPRLRIQNFCGTLKFVTNDSASNTPSARGPGYLRLGFFFQIFRFLSSVVQSSVDLVGSFGTIYDPSAPLSPAITTNSTKICTTNFTGTPVHSLYEKYRRGIVRKISLGKTYSTVLWCHKILYRKNQFFRKDCSKCKVRNHGMCWGGWGAGGQCTCAQQTALASVMEG